MFFEKAKIREIPRKSFTTERILKAHNYVEYELCRWFFSRNFPKIFRAAIIKENLPIDVPYFIKEHLWMSASDETTLKKNFGGSKPKNKMVPWKQNGTKLVTLKTKWYQTCGCSDDSRCWEQLKKHVTDKYFEKKVKTLNPCHLPLQEMYVTITILVRLVSTWCICLTKIPEEKHLKLSDSLTQI